MVTQPTDKSANDVLPSDEWNWIVDMIDGTGVTFANAGDSLKITRNQSAGSAAVVQIIQDHASDSSNAVNIQNDGTGVGLRIRTVQTTNEYVFLGYTNNSVGTNYFYRNLGSADTSGPVVNITQDNASDDQNALYVRQDGTGNGINIDVNGNTRAIRVDNNNDNSKDQLAFTAPIGATNTFAVRWNTNIDRYVFYMGDGANINYMWCEAGKLRIHTSDPTTATDGVVVGTQT